MKGFMHVVEIIIVVLTLFLVMSQFAFIPGIQADWPKTKLFLYGNDMLFSLNSQDINWFNASEVEPFLTALLPKSVGFRLNLKNVIKPHIIVGCVCTQNQVRLLRETLRGFDMNGLNVSFAVGELNASAINFGLNYDVIFLWGNYDLSGYTTQLSRYLNNRGGVIAYENLPSTDQIHREYFNVQWMSEPVSGLPVVGFPDADPDGENYIVEKYFTHIPFRVYTASTSAPNDVVSCTGNYARGHFSMRDSNYTTWVIDNSTGSCNLAVYIDKNDNGYLLDSEEGPFNEGDSFTLEGYDFSVKRISWSYAELLFGHGYEFSDFSSETVYPIKDPERSIILQQNATYESGKHVPVAVLNHKIVSGRGRTAWISQGELSSDMRQFIKSVVAWAAGNEHQVIQNVIKKIPSSFSMYKILSQDMFQPVEINLILGYLL